MSDTPITDAAFKEFNEDGRSSFLRMTVHAQKLERDRAELVECLRELMLRCDGAEGVRADGSNIQTMAAHALLAKLESK